MSLTQICPARLESPSHTPIVYVIDGDASVREALGLMIQSAGWAPRTVRSAGEFLALPRELRPSCLVTELRLSDLCGLELQRLLLDRTELPIIFISDRIDVCAAVRAIKAGALEFLTKPLATDKLMGAVHNAIDCSRVALHRLGQMHVLETRYATLSKREREVMGLVVSGRLNKQVSFDLGISEITVKQHRGRLMRKMRAGSFAELVTMFSRLHRWASEAAGMTPTELAGSHITFPDLVNV
jgi:FixJ family two-component response regulator